MSKKAELNILVQLGNADAALCNECEGSIAKAGNPCAGYEGFYVNEDGAFGYTWVYVVCQDCGQRTGISNSLKEAISRWNIIQGQKK